jgi:hypothetical protein
VIFNHQLLRWRALLSNKTNSILTTDVQHFFAERIFVYLFWKTRFISFKLSFPEFQHLRNKYAKDNMSLWICNSNPIIFNFQHFQQISIKFLLFSARPFVHYFVPRIRSCMLSIQTRRQSKNQACATRLHLGHGTLNPNLFPSHIRGGTGQYSDPAPRGTLLGWTLNCSNKLKA